MIAERKRGKRSTAIAFAAGQSEGLADFVWSKMPSLIEEFRRQQGDREVAGSQAFAANAPGA